MALQLVCCSHIKSSNFHGSKICSGITTLSLTPSAPFSEGGKGRPSTTPLGTNKELDPNLQASVDLATHCQVPRNLLLTIYMLNLKSM